MEKLKPVEHKLKDLSFYLLRFLLKKGREDFIPLKPSNIGKILFLRPDKIGDMIISLPVFENLKKQHPHIKLSLLCSPRNYGIVKNDPRFEKIFLYRKNIFKDITTVLAMRKENYDAVVDMISNDSITNLFLARFSVKNKPRIGVQKLKYRDYYDYSYYHRLDDMRHIIRNTLELLEAFGLDSEQADGFAPPYVDDKTRMLAEVFIKVLRTKEPNKLNIGYNLSVGNPTRVWDGEKSRLLVKRILDSEQGNYRIIVLTAPSDRTRGDELAGHFKKDVVQIPSGLNLTAVSAIISKLDLLITPDTSLVHIARSFKVPVVGLYPKPVKNFLLWHPFEQKEGAVLSGNNDNIFDITVEQVFETFTQVVNNHRLVKK
ncbi:MAG: glycosyltransferase family 9 protein [candidate division Zixibacteria bacterium]|nr:glycosyltransferase family 9 protein [candidate division Zixibacteria bacterium]